MIISSSAWLGVEKSFALLPISIMKQLEVAVSILPKSAHLQQAMHFFRSTWLAF